jgi:hypothetical protein
MTECKFNPNSWTTVLAWLEQHVQPSYTLNGDKFNYSVTAQYNEWRSRDCETWIMRLQGTPVKGLVKFNDSKFATMFTLRWSK